MNIFKKIKQIYKEEKLNIKNNTNNNVVNINNLKRNEVFNSFDKNDWNKWKNLNYLKEMKIYRFENYAMAKKWHDILIKDLPNILSECLKNSIDDNYKYNKYYIMDYKIKMREFFQLIQSLLNINDNNIELIKPINKNDINKPIQKHELTTVYNFNSKEFKEQQNKIIKDFIPDVNFLLKVPPMQIVDYMNIQWYLYDKYYGYYIAYITINNVDDFTNPIIIYSKNIKETYERAKIKFDELTNKQRQSNSLLNDFNINKVNHNNSNNKDMENLQKIKNNLGLNNNSISDDEDFL